MTRPSVIPKAVALTLAIVAHGAVALTLVPPAPAMIEGGTGTMAVRLGNAFEDLAVGSPTATQPEMIEADTPTALPQPRQSQALAPQTPETAPTQDTAARLVPAPAVMSPASQPNQTLAPAPPQQRIHAMAQEAQETEITTAAVVQSLRPQVRKAAPRQTRKTRETAKQTTRGTSAQSARVGAATGQERATARQTGDAGRANDAGSAAASAYPGLVMRALSRAGKPRVRATGAAVIAFTIAASGGVSAVSLAQSSGSATLDQAALQLVRSAAPFPRPPQGARRSFSIRIKGR